MCQTRYAINPEILFRDTLSAFALDHVTTVFLGDIKNTPEKGDRNFAQDENCNLCLEIIDPTFDLIIIPIPRYVRLVFTDD